MPFIQSFFCIQSFSKQIGTKHFFTGHFVYLIHCCKTVIFSVCTHINQSRAVQTMTEKFENGALFLRLGLPSTLIRLENVALFLRLGLSSTLIRHENGALFLRLGLSSTLIHHENGALFLRLGLSSTVIRHENGVISVIM